jgi:YgiT-type zinc finger domain-containing protein
VICAFCKGKYENGLTAYVTTLIDSIIVIKNVPCLMCDQCGEVSYIGTVYSRLEQIVVSLENSITEVAVVRYTPAA